MNQEIRKKLLNEFEIEIGGGLGPLKGKVWRIGLMGESSRSEYVLTLLSALEQLLPQAGEKITPGESLKAATEIFARSLSSPIGRFPVTSLRFFPSDT